MEAKSGSPSIHQSTRRLPACLCDWKNKSQYLIPELSQAAGINDQLQKILMYLWKATRLELPYFRGLSKLRILERLINPLVLCSDGFIDRQRRHPTPRQCIPHLHNPAPQTRLKSRTGPKSNTSAGNNPYDYPQLRMKYKPGDHKL